MTNQRERLLKGPEGREVRLVTLNGIEVRKADGDGPIGFKGTAAVFNSRTKIGASMWGWFEEIRPGTFEQSIGEDDIRMLKNHNTDLVLARNVAGNLRLEERKKGLTVDADMTPTTYAHDLAKSLDVGDVSQMSFGFEVKDDEWITLDDDDPDKGKVAEPELRIIKRVKLWEVSPVTFPAYTDTDAALRYRDLDMLARGLGLDDEQLHRLARQMGDGEAGELLRQAAAVGRALATGFAINTAPATASTRTGYDRRRERAADLFPEIFGKAS